MKQAAAYSDNGAIFIARGGSEGGDLSDTDITLRPSEIGMIEKVAGAFADSLCGKDDSLCGKRFHSVPK